MQDYYDSLNLQRNASKEEISEAYVSTLSVLENEREQLQQAFNILSQATVKNNYGSDVISRCYEVLDLDIHENISESIIKNQFDELMEENKYEAEIIQEAYTTLSDDLQRDLYDGMYSKYEQEISKETQVSMYDWLKVLTPLLLVVVVITVLGLNVKYDGNWEMLLLIPIAWFVGIVLFVLSTTILSASTGRPVKYRGTVVANPDTLKKWFKK